MPETGIRDRVLEEIRTFASAYGIETVILFGSRARGDYRERSDIDLAVSGGTRAQKARFALDVDEEAHTLLFFDVVDLDGPVNEDLRESIRREGVVIYETEKV